MADTDERGWWFPFLWVFKRMEAFGRLITRALNVVLVGLVFFLAIGPLSLVLRVMGKNILEPERSGDSGTFWIERAEIPPELERFSRQF